MPQREDQNDCHSYIIMKTTTNKGKNKIKLADMRGEGVEAV